LQHGSNPMTDIRVSEALAREEARFVADRERFRAEEGCNVA
jgi:hypothetical protein